MNTTLINGEPRGIIELTSIETLITDLKLRSAQIALMASAMQKCAEAGRETYFAVRMPTLALAPPLLLMTPFSKLH